MNSIKLTKLQKKEMKKVFGGQEETCKCSSCPSCNCGGGDAIPARTQNKHTNQEFTGMIVHADIQLANKPIQTDN